MTTLRISIELNPGGEGVRLDKLAKFSGEAEKFLRYLLGDLGLQVPQGDFVAKKFYNSSVGFVSELPRSVEDSLVPQFNESILFFTNFRESSSTLDTKYNRRTVSQFVEMGKCLDPDERARIGLYDLGVAGDVPSGWQDLTRSPALALEAIVTQPLTYHGSIQGRLGTWFKGTNHFDLREVIHNKTVKCNYDDDKYPEVYALYEDKNTVVHVVGTVSADRVDGTPREIKLERMKVYDRLSNEEFDRVFGLSPDLTGDEGTSDFIDYVRRDDDA